MFFSFVVERALQAGLRTLPLRKLSVVGVIELAKNYVIQ
jgi:hypothetical protein